MNTQSAWFDCPRGRGAEAVLFLSRLVLHSYEDLRVIQASTVTWESMLHYCEDISLEVLGSVVFTIGTLSFMLA